MPSPVRRAYHPANPIIASTSTACMVRDATTMASNGNTGISAKRTTPSAIRRPPHPAVRVRSACRKEGPSSHAWRQNASLAGSPRESSPRRRENAIARPIQTDAMKNAPKRDRRDRVGSEHRSRIPSHG